MKRLLVTLLSCLAFMQARAAGDAPVAGSTTVSIAAASVQEVTLGLSARKQILGHTVFNDQGDTVGKIDDLIVSPDRDVSIAIVGVGGFLGVKRHHVAVPVALFTRRNDIFLLPGATKDAIKSLPAFDYAEP